MFQTIDTNIFWILIKIIVVGILLLYTLINFGNYKQIKNINNSLKTELSGLINFLVLLRVLGLVLAIILVILA